MMPMPSGPSAPMDAASSSQGPPQGQQSPDPSLLGASPAIQPSPSPDQINQALMAEIQDLTTRITSLARQFPVGAENFEVAVQSLIEAMTKTIISSTSTEPTQAPNLVG